MLTRLAVRWLGNRREYVRCQYVYHVNSVLAYLDCGVAIEETER